MKFYICFMLLTFSTISIAQEYLYQHGDLSIKLNQGMIYEGIKRLGGTEYQADYITNGRVCSSPWINIKLNSSQIFTTTKIDMVSGKSKAGILPSFSVSAHAEQCLPNGINVKCKGEASISSLLNPIPVSSQCSFKAQFLGFPLFGSKEIQLGDPIPPILGMNKSHKFNLKNTAKNLMEYGSFQNDIWTPSLSPYTKEIKFYSDVYGSGSTNFSAQSRFSSWTETPILVSNVYVDKRYYSSNTDRKLQEDNYSNFGDFDLKSTFIQLEISPSFFVKKSDNKTSGIFGKLLPIRIKNESFDIALVDANIKFGQLDKNERIVIGFKVKSISTGAVIQNANVYLSYSFPEIVNNSIELELKEAKLELDGEEFGTKICFNENLLDNFSDFSFPLNKVVTEIDIALPDCIKVNNNRMQPERTCQDGTKKGALSRHINLQNTKLVIKVDHMKFKINQEGTLVVSIPADEVIYE